MKLRPILGAMILLLAGQVNAEIISGDLFTDGGKSVDLSGLE